MANRVRTRRPTSDHELVVDKWRFTMVHQGVELNFRSSYGKTSDSINASFGTSSGPAPPFW